jgi:two-component system, sensor histidine kinase PdtaS
MIKSVRSRLFSRLWVRLATMLGLALVPIAIVAFLQTSALNTEVRTRAESGMLGTTLRAAEMETSLIRRAQGLIASAAQAVPNVVGNDAVCSDLMRRIASTEPAASLVIFVPVTSIVTCSSKNQVFDLHDNPLVSDLLKSQTAQFIVNRHGPISGTSILGISEPVFDDGGTYLGYVSMSLPHDVIAAMQSGDDDLDNGGYRLSAYWTFDKNGEILTTSTDMDEIAAYLPKNRAMITAMSKHGEVFLDASVAGTPMTYAVVPIVEDKVYLMSSWTTGNDTFWEQFRGPAYLAPAMLLIAGLIVASFAAEHLVARHIRELSRSIRRISDGDRRLQRLTLSGAPIEIIELADAYREMNMSIIQNEAQLEDALHQKDVLLREVHHRVKNNLQLIASIMNLQLRRAHSPETRSTLKGLQDRVLSLATIHRGLYQTSGMADVNAHELLPDIIRQIINLSTGREKPFDVKTEIASLRLVPDQAVPLSLLLTEALTNAIKYAGAKSSEPGTIRITLSSQSDDYAVLEIWNSKTLGSENEAVSLDDGTGLGGQLINAFVQQLGATAEVDSTPEHHALRVTFHVAPLTSGEHQKNFPAPREA